MNTLIRVLMLLMVLGSVGTPVSARVSHESMSASDAMPMQHEMATETAAKHACCDGDDSSNLITIQHADCDNACSDCQHHCAGSASALTQTAFTFPTTLPALPLRIEGSVTTARPGYLDRPPMA
ncbi:MAG TPA: hypothetical protein VFM61_08735 [Pseudidiomarina sp.]|nr:hypothetical protein [Pseudidiomarina sp.]